MASSPASPTSMTSSAATPRRKPTPAAAAKRRKASWASACGSSSGGEASKAQVVTKGSISLALTGKGTGRTLGVSFGSFIISARK